MKKLYANIFVLLSIAVMILIFYFSSEPDVVSAAKSTALTDLVVQVLKSIDVNLSTDFNTAEYQQLDYFIRKMAHFSIYTALGFCVFGAIKAGKIKFAPLYALAFCAVYAISDEVHQLFVLGRTGKVSDVVIDLVGVVCGLGIYYLTLSRPKHLG